MAAPANPLKPLNLIGGAAGAVGGWLLSAYCGANLWLPGIALVLLLVIFARTPVRPRYFVGAIAATAAHLAFLVVGFVQCRRERSAPPPLPADAPA